MMHEVETITADRKRDQAAGVAPIFSISPKKRVGYASPMARDHSSRNSDGGSHQANLVESPAQLQTRWSQRARDSALMGSRPSHATCMHVGVNLQAQW
ncbi:hypothetical protein VNO77_27670 [Canavalia gladiata]|uniref:Uncharacterized protein n=1 Tax=Canavalia gladiata TaxID=3824 RepID=A0AAN9KV32_CANGL